MTIPAVLEITELCPDCNGCGVLSERGGLYAVVCEDCRSYLHGETSSIVLAVEAWNTNAVSGDKGCWPKWLALLPEESELETHIDVISAPVTQEPDLTLYEPYVHHSKFVEIDNSKFAPVTQRVEK